MRKLETFFEPNNPHCFTIAEVAQSHDGSLGQAYAFVDAVAQSGADAIKFQTHIATAESTPDEPFRVKFSRQDANRYEYWQRMEFTEAQWYDLAAYVKSKGLYFLSSPFSMEAVTLLDSLVPAWKIGSGEVNNLPMLDAICKTGKPILLSSGMSTWAELEKSVTFLRNRKAVFAVMQATSMYPTPPEKLGLNVIAEINRRFGCPVGFSDHSASIFPAIAAYTLGARFVEVHVTLSRWMFGPDVSSSLTVEELTQMVTGIRLLETAKTHPIDKDTLAVEMSSLREMFCKSIVARQDLPVGKILEPKDLTIKKPAKGIPADRLPAMYGRRLKRSLSKDAFLEELDLDPIEPAVLPQ